MMSCHHHGYRLLACTNKLTGGACRPITMDTDLPLSLFLTLSSTASTRDILINYKVLKLQTAIAIPTRLATS